MHKRGYPNSCCYSYYSRYKNLNPYHLPEGGEGVLGVEWKFYAPVKTRVHILEFKIKLFTSCENLFYSKSATIC